MFSMVCSRNNSSFWVETGECDGIHPLVKSEDAEFLYPYFPLGNLYFKQESKSFWNESSRQKMLFPGQENASF